MITALEIENFKAFGDRQRIEFRPITMLFGPNSGGKSSVTHAMHYLREVLWDGELDAHKTWSGGDSVDLGGIRNFAHGRRVGTVIRLKVEFAISGVELPVYRGTESPFDPERLGWEEILRGRITNASVELQIHADERPTLRLARIGLNGTPIGELRFPPNRPHAEVADIAWSHPIFADTSEGADGRGLLAQMCPLDREARHVALPIKRSRNVLPRLDASLEFPSLQLEAEAMEYESGTSFPRRMVDDFEIAMSMLLLGPMAVLRDKLADFRYVGPLRSIPPRHLEPQDRSGRSRWGTGLQAWELLAHGHERNAVARERDNELLEGVSRWLEAAERLDTGYRLEREEFKQVPAAIAALACGPACGDHMELIARTMSGLPLQSRIVLRDIARNVLLQPQDVGVGFSQIVPVLVALLDRGGSLVALEQPELHLHPRQQAALGDLLIEASKSCAGSRSAEKRLVIVETHSEHLILRLLRRIRESSERKSTDARSFVREDLGIVYVESRSGAATVAPMRIDAKGEFLQPWPDTFFDQDSIERFGSEG